MVAKVLTAVAIVALATIALAVPAVRHLREVPPPLAPAIRAAFPSPPGTELGSGDDVLDVAISPDQRQIVFVATTGGTGALWRRSLDSDRAEQIVGTEGARLPAWKQTGNVISFFAGDRLKQVSLIDGAIRDLATARDALGATWLRDGSLLYAADHRDVIRRLHDGTMSDATKMRDGERWHGFPMAAGDDGSFVYTAAVEPERHVVRLVDAEGERDLVTTSGHGQLVGDTLLYVRDRVLLGQRLAPETRQLSGRAVPIALDVGTHALQRSFFAASPRVLITAPAVSRDYQLSWFPLPDGKDTPIGEPSDYWQVRLSPDDRFAALTQTTSLLGTLDVIVMPLVEGAGLTQQLTRAVAPDSDPVWSPDGKVIAFRSFQDGPPRLYSHLAHFDGAEDVIVPKSTTDETPTDWRDDRIVVRSPGAKGNVDLWTVNAQTGAREAIASTGFNESDGRISPDGRWLAYVSDESGEPDIYATPWPRGARVRISFAGGTRPRWRRDGRALFFLRGKQIMRADVSGTGFTTPRAVLEIGSMRDFDVAHRHDAILALIPAPLFTSATASLVVDWRSLMN